MHLFHRFAIAVALSACVNATAFAAAKQEGKGPEHWEPTINKFETDDKANPPAKGTMLLVGGSNARRWTDVGTYFPGETVLNRGFGGALLSDVVYYSDRIVVPYAPKLILLNAGGNDLGAGKSPEDVRDAFKQFIEKMHAALPKAKIIYVCIPYTPNSSKKEGSLELVKHTNSLIQEVIKQNPQCRYIDLFPEFVDEKGQPKKELYVEDGTHFNPKGHEIVARLIRETKW